MNLLPRQPHPMTYNAAASGLALQGVMDMMAGEWGFAMRTVSGNSIADAFDSWSINSWSPNSWPNNLFKDNNNMQGLALRLFRSRQKRQPEDDVELLAAIGRGNQAAMASLYRQYHPRLFRFLSLNVYDRDAIEEVINDTMHVVWQSSQQFRGESKVSTWIFGIAYRKSIAANQITRKHRAAELTEADVASMQWQEQTQQSQTMQQALAQLSSVHRMVVELTYYGGFSYQDIAGIMACPENTVKTRMFYARRHLQQLMQDDEAPDVVAPAVVAAVNVMTVNASPVEGAHVEDA
jgi:RNA polymerase sigma factor (sigma-70 family)